MMWIHRQPHSSCVRAQVHEGSATVCTVPRTITTAHVMTVRVQAVSAIAASTWTRASVALPERTLGAVMLCMDRYVRVCVCVLCVCLANVVLPISTAKWSSEWKSPFATISEAGRRITKESSDSHVSVLLDSPVSKGVHTW